MAKYALYSYDSDRLTEAVRAVRSRGVKAMAYDANWLGEKLEPADNHLIVPSGDAKRDAELLATVAGHVGEDVAAILSDAKHASVKAYAADVKPKPPADAGEGKPKGSKGKAAAPVDPTEPDPDA